MAKRYARLNWQNAPSVATPINAVNLNILDKGIDDLDNAIEAQATQIQMINDNLTGLTTLTGYFLGAAPFGNDCNNMPLGATGYTYDITLNSPGASYIVFCFGVNPSYAVQIAVEIGAGTFKARFCNEAVWSEWRSTALT